MPEKVHISPSFAREAEQHLHDGDIRQALELCLAGTRAFPLYATGHLILGKCYDASERPAEALVEYKRALDILPDNSTLQSLANAAEDKRDRLAKKSEEEHQRKLPPDKGTFSMKKTGAEAAKKPEQNQEEGGTSESALEHLAKVLQGVKRIQPTTATSPASIVSLPPNAESQSVRFVTATMAEIFLDKGEYTEAITIYRELLKQRPEEDATIRQRIVEIEQLLTKQEQQKKLDGPQNTKAS